MGRKGPNLAMRKSTRELSNVELYELLNTAASEVHYVKDRKLNKIYYRIQKNIEKARAEDATTLRLSEYQWNYLDVAHKDRLERKKKYEEVPKGRSVPRKQKAEKKRKTYSFEVSIDGTILMEFKASNKKDAKRIARELENAVSVSIDQYAKERLFNHDIYVQDDTVLNVTKELDAGQIVEEEEK